MRDIGGREKKTCHDIESTISSCPLHSSALSSNSHHSSTVTGLEMFTTTLKLMEIDLNRFTYYDLNRYLNIGNQFPNNNNK